MKGRTEKAGKGGVSVGVSGRGWGDLFETPKIISKIRQFRDERHFVHGFGVYINIEVAYFQMLPYVHSWKVFLSPILCENTV